MNATMLGMSALVLTLVSGVLWIRALKSVSLPENRSGYLAAFVLAGVLGIVALSQNPGWLVGVPAVFSIVIALFFSLTFAIGGQFVGPDAIAVGDTLPTFTAIDEHGETFDSLSLAGNPVLIKFFRGLW